MTAYIEINNISKQYGKEKVLSEFSLSMHEGELITLLGASGCGKTTLLKILAGLVSQDEGSFYVDSVNYTNLNPEQRRVGYVPQSQTLFPHMSVKDNIMFGIRGTLSKEQKKRKLKELTEIGEIEPDLLEKLPGQLSGGQKQRIALLRAIASDPKILLLDEPLSSLDQTLRQKLAFFLQDLIKSNEITTLHVTHDPTEASKISDKLAVLQYGHIIQKDTPKKMFQQPNSYEAARALAIQNIVFSKKGAEKLVDNIESHVFNDLSHALYNLSHEEDVAFLIPEEAISLHKSEDPSRKYITIKAKLQASHFSITNEVYSVFRLESKDKPHYLYKTFESPFDAPKTKKLDVFKIHVNVHHIRKLNRYII